MSNEDLTGMVLVLIVATVALTAFLRWGMV